MMRTSVAVVTSACLVLALGTSQMALAAKKETAKGAKPMMCPVCKTMPLATKKSKANPQMVKINGKTYYCCAACDMSKVGKAHK
jgi:hypothetical protein